VEELPRSMIHPDKSPLRQKLVDELDQELGAFFTSSDINIVR
jgi:hypothetical protein